MKALVTLVAVAMTMNLYAYKGSVSFSASEIRQHELKMGQFMTVAKNCLNNYKTTHINFFRSNCINRGGKQVCLSKYFGDRRYSKKRGKFRSDGKPLQYLGDALRAAGFPESMMSQMENTSCVGMALSCLSQAFKATGQSAQWQKIRRFVYANNVGGTGLQHALQKIGWTIYYWNPEPSWSIDAATKRWDIEEKNWASKGWHNYRLITVRNHNRYWHNRVDDKYTMVGFDKGTPRVLYNVPFWVGTAHTGYHVFPGSYEEVIEAHSTQPITAFKNMEFSTFSPMRSGGGPRWTATQKYRSGLIALPPGY